MAASLILCLQVLKSSASSQCRHKYTWSFIASAKGNDIDPVVDDAPNVVVLNCEALIENGTLSIGTGGHVQTIAGDEFKVIAEVAKKEMRLQWKPSHKNRAPIWVIREFAKCCALRVNSEDAIGPTGVPPVSCPPCLRWNGQSPEGSVFFI